MSGTLRVVTVTTSYPRWDGDFAGHFIASLAEELATHGHTISVIAPHDPSAPSAEMRNGVRIIRPRYLPDRLESVAYGHGIIPNVRENPLRVLGVPALALSLRTALRQASNDADLVHVHWGPTALLSGVRRSRLPVVVSLHGSEVTLAQRGGPWGVLLGRSVRGADAIDVMAASQERVVRERSSFDGPIEIIPSGVPLELTERPRPARDPNTTTITFVGRLVAEKGIDELVEAFCERAPGNAGLRLVIAGTGPREPWIRRRVEEAGLAQRVELLGRLEHSEALEVIARADVLALPSHGEGSPLSVTEALALGTPIVSTDVGALPDLVGAAGILVGRGDIAALGAAIETLVADRAMRERMGAEGRERIARTRTWPAIAAHVEALYRVAIAAHATTGSR